MQIQRIQSEHLTDRVICHTNTMADTVVDTSNVVVTIQWTLFQVSSILPPQSDAIIYAFDILEHVGTSGCYLNIVFIKDA